MQNGTDGTDGTGSARNPGEEKRTEHPKEPILLRPIGVIRSPFKEKTDAEKMKREISTIIIYPEYEKGLLNIEDNRIIDVVFYLHKVEKSRLIVTRKDGKTTGVFDSRAPFRPNPIGITTVRLLERKGRTLFVKGLDAIDMTPLLDIKPYRPPEGTSEPKER